MIPALVGAVPFGLVTGVAAAGSGLSTIEGLGLSVFSFSGIAMLITMQLIAAGSPLPLIVGAALIVSLRHVMYSASLAPHLAHLDRRWRALLCYLMTDQSFASTVRHYSEPGDRTHRHWHFLGASITLWTTWQGAVLAGLVAGAGVPASWSLDFVVVLTFVALLVPVVRTRADLAAGVVAAVVALVSAGMPYRLSLIVGSLAGILVGLAIERAHRGGAK